MTCAVFQTPQSSVSYVQAFEPSLCAASRFDLATDLRSFDVGFCATGLRVGVLDGVRVTGGFAAVFALGFGLATGFDFFRPNRLRIPSTTPTAILARKSGAARNLQASAARAAIC
jgi:hypothetical protein